MQKRISKGTVFGVVLGVMSVAMRLGAMGDVPSAAPEVASIIAHAADARAVAIACDLNARDTNDDTALLRATKALDVDEVKRLLGLGDDPNVPDNDGRTAFWYACMGEISEDQDLKARRKEIVKLLYREGADDLRVKPGELCSDILLSIAAQDRNESGDPHPLKLRSAIEPNRAVEVLLQAIRTGDDRMAMEAMYVGRIRDPRTAIEMLEGRWAGVDLEGKVREDWMCMGRPVTRWRSISGDTNSVRP